MSASGGFSKAAARAKAKGLTIKTNLTFDSPAPTIKNGDAFANLATAPPHKHVFGVTAEKPPAPKRSEALLNSDWRNNRRHRSGSSEQYELLTAPPDKLKFSNEETKAPQRKLKLDTAAAQSYGPRRYRESPIDPDFIFSAPATKQEFLDALEEDDILSANKENFEIMEPRGKLDQCAKSLVRLESLPYHTRQQLEEIMNWDVSSTEPSSAGVTSNWSSATAVTPYGSAGTSDKEVNFPLAEIHAVKNSKRLHTVGWDGIDKHIRKTLEKLIEPRTAGLPVDKLRDEYKKGQQALAQKAVLDDSLTKDLKADGKHDGDGNQDPFQKTREEQSRFDALIGKLQKSASSRARAYCPAATSSSKLSPVAKNAENDAWPKLDEPVKKADISHAMEKKPLAKATTATSLNPKASEFFSAAQCQQLPQQQQLGGVSNISPIIPSPSDAKAKDTAPKLTMEELLSRIEELEAQIKGQSPEESHHYVSAAAQALTQNFAGQFDMGIIPQAPVAMRPRAQDTRVSVDLTGSGMNAMAVAPGMAPSAFPQQMPFNGGGMQPAGVHQHDSMPLAAPIYQQGQNGHGPTPPAPTPAYPGVHPAGPHVGGQAALPPRPDPVPFGPAFPQQNPQQNHQQNPAASSTPMMARSMFGPKPVRKPKGPFRPGDPVQAMQQQQYEEYLEWRRHNDPEYAQKCKVRQARRAQRQRSGQDRSDSSDTAKMTGSMMGVKA
ncbi:hypothetical protein F4775DRAFT_400586 [Biscogniauxia sp. FL1348]|nr:hypothetical protein F4775DRAFT_400586 [Biscogniauxia sp. FL1348]